MTYEEICPKCHCGDVNPPDEEGSWPSCNDCGHVQYSPEMLDVMAEVRREQAVAKHHLGYIPTFAEATAKGWTR